jgi:hypothetical protein
MKAKNLVAAAFSLFIFPLAICDKVTAQGTAFTYQGQLAESGAAANGNFDFVFGLYTNVSTGNLIGTMETNLDVGVTNGLFTTTLNFSNAFNGTAYWLGIGVRSNSTTNAFVTLTPRQEITPTPYAITASNLTGTLSASQLTGQIAASNFSGTFSNGVSFTNTANVFAGNGSGLVNVPGVTASNFVFADDYTDQVLAGGYQVILFATNTLSGWTLPTSGEFVAGATGLYLVNYSVHVWNDDNTTVAVMTRGILNYATSPTQIAGSEADIDIPSGYVNKLSHSFIVVMSAEEMLSIQISCNTADVAEIYSADFESATIQLAPFAGATINIVRIQ